MAAYPYTLLISRQYLSVIEYDRFRGIRRPENTYWKDSGICYSFAGITAINTDAVDSLFGLNLLRNFAKVLVNVTDYSLWLLGVKNPNQNACQVFNPIRVIILFGWLLTLLPSNIYCQCIVKQDESKNIITTCQGNTPTKNSFLINRQDQGQTTGLTVYLGNPFLTYPIYQDGTLEFATNQPRLSYKIAFNLVAQEVSFLLPEDNTEHAVFPDAFTLNGRHFVSRIDSYGKRQYYEVLYGGKSKVLAHHTSTLTVFNKEPYQLNETVDGTYRQQESYLIELEGKSPQKITLSKRSVLKVLDTKINHALLVKTKDKLTLLELIGAVASYDGFQ